MSDRTNAFARALLAHLGIPEKNVTAVEFVSEAGQEEMLTVTMWADYPAEMTTRRYIVTPEENA